MVGLLFRRALVHPASYHTRDSSRARPSLSIVYHYLTSTSLAVPVPDLPPVRAHRPTEARIIIWAPWENKAHVDSEIGT